MSNLADPDTGLDRFFVELGESAAQVAPVAEVQARLFAKMADTFAAFAESPTALQQTIEKSPPTLAASIESFRATRPFLADFADLAGRLRPAARELPRSLPPLNSALAVGTPVLPRTVDLSDRLGASFAALGDLMERPATLLALRDLREGVAVSRPALEFIAPYQTVCNHFIYFIHSLGELQSLVQTGPTGGGTVLNQNIKFVNFEQPNNLGSISSSRPWDVPPDEDPRTATNAAGNLGRVYSPPYSPAIDAQGNADCQVGQMGYIRGPWTTGGRYTRGELSDGTPDGRQLVRHRQRPAGPARRHLQVARSSASRTWRTCHEPAERLQGRRDRDRGHRGRDLVRVHAGQPVRQPVRAEGVLPRREQHQDALAGADRGRRDREGHEGRGRRGRLGRRGGHDGDRGQGPADPPRRAAQDPAADLPRGQLLRRPPAGVAVRARARVRRARCRPPRPPRRCRSARC